MSDNPNSPIILTRPEQPALYSAIFEVQRAAFGRDDEAQVVDLVRQSPAFNPKLSIMALYDGQVVGHILVSHASLQGHEELALAALGPIAVLPDYQRQLIGSALMYEGLEVARRHKFQAIVILGNPKFYGRFGFRLARDKGLSTKFDPTGEHFMVQELTPHSLDGISGLVDYHPAFDGV